MIMSIFQQSGKILRKQFAVISLYSLKRRSGECRYIYMFHRRKNNFVPSLMTSRTEKFAVTHIPLSVESRVAVIYRIQHLVFTESV